MLCWRLERNGPWKVTFSRNPCLLACPITLVTALQFHSFGLRKEPLLKWRSNNEVISYTFS